MTPNRGLALFRFWFALLGFLAILFQLAHLLQNVPGASAGNFFSYFTIQSNIIAFITLAIAGRYVWKGESPRWLELLRGAATIYMTITGIVYNLLLSNIDVNTPIPWINVVLHYTIPTIMVIDWLVDLQNQGPCPHLADLARVSPPLPDLQPDPRSHRRLVPLPVPGPPGQRLRNCRRHGAGHRGSSLPVRPYRGVLHATSHRPDTCGSHLRDHRGTPAVRHQHHQLSTGHSEKTRLFPPGFICLMTLTRHGPSGVPGEPMSRSRNVGPASVSRI